ncbi:MAG: hypothetical protein AAF682_08450 [Planctomycetota bacterium]
MNTAATVLLSASAAVVVTVGAELLRGDRGSEAGAATSLDATLTDLAKHVESIKSTQSDLRGELAELRMRPAEGGSRMPVGEIEAAVERYLEGRADELDETLVPVEPVLAESELDKVDVRSLIEALTDPTADWMEREELWQRLREEGRLDEVIAEFERMAELDPNNPDSQVELGYAYIQKIQEVGASALAGKWATMADEQFDKALALDENHWSARYSKAISLSHWPAFTGKTGEAIQELEKLIDIQAGSPPDDNHVQTYLSLGNIYLGQGKNDLALSTWEKGLSLFPTNAQLAQQVESLQQ